MKIEILGSGCAKCKKVAELAQQAAQELGLEAEIVKVTKLDKITAYGVMLTPALVIDGQVKSSGIIPDVEEIKTWLKEQSQK